MDVAYEQSFPTPLANSTLLIPLLLSLAKDKNSPTTNQTFNKDKEYDFVIVGAGSAGATLANRLSEITCANVLLLEAGRSPPILNDVPVIQRTFRGTSLDWQYLTTPQKYIGASLNNRQVLWPVGKGLGGSSMLNAMKFVRGNKKNFDDWAEQGATGWSFKDVYPYFQKLENNLDPEYAMDGYHHVGGPMSAEKPKYQAEIKQPIIDAAESLGYKLVDSNGATQTGFYDFQGTKQNSQRCSTAKAYLVPAENRTNLDIVINAFVTKVKFHKKRATGVVFNIGNETHTVRAKREVILSAGTINTAQLLMLSGVGPKKELKKFNISVIANLPVGKNLHDHGSGIVVNFALGPAIPTLHEKISNDSNIEQFLNNRTGILASIAGVSMLAFLNSNKSLPLDVDDPNYELYLFESEAETEKVQFNLKQEIFDQYYAPYKSFPLFTCFACLLQPFSRGAVTLQSSDPYDYPLLNPNYLKDQRDVDAVVGGMKTCLQIGRSEQLKLIGTKQFETLYPGCENLINVEDEYLACQARSAIVSLNHYVGVAKMGDLNDPTTVVDPSLKVKGIEGLRVVDASVMPSITSGNTNIPVIMIAEKASDIIKKTIDCSAN